MIEYSEKIKKRYNRYSYLYDFLEFLPEQLFFRHYRRQIISTLKGKVLEIGVGTGKNLGYYQEDTQVTAIDFSPQMLAVANRQLDILGRKNITLQLADVEKLPFPDHYFDMVVATFVFCSVPNPVRGLEEVRRVLKVGGQAIFLEHVRSSNRLVAKLQDLFNPITLGLTGTNINRRTRENIIKAGLELVEDKKMGMGDIVRLFVARPSN